MARKRGFSCGIVVFVHQGQPQVPEAVEQAAFGDFESVPGSLMPGLPQVGDHLGEPARPEEQVRVARWHRPVT